MYKTQRSRKILVIGTLLMILLILLIISAIKNYDMFKSFLQIMGILIMIAIIFGSIPFIVSWIQNGED